MSRHSALLQVHVAAALFGLAGLFAISTGLDATVITFGRTFFAACALALLSRLLKIDFACLLTLPVVASGVLLAAHWVLFFKSIQLSTVAVGLITFSVSPVMITLLEPWCFREKWKPSHLAAGIGVLLGLVLMSGIYSGEVVYAAGIAIGLASSLLFALLQILNRQLSIKNSAASLSFAQNSIASILVFGFVYSSLPAISLPQWSQLLFLGCVCTALAHTMFINTLKALGASVASILAAGLEPVYGIVFAIVLYAQFPDVNVLVGGAIVLLTVVVISVERQ